VRIHPQVILRQVEDEAVLLNLDDGTYYGLNPVGARMVEILHEATDVGTACQMLLQEYDVDAERLRHDMERLASEMHARGLVTVEP
jgi:hypothetical protein